MEAKGEHIPKERLQLIEDLRAGMSVEELKALDANPSDAYVNAVSGGGQGQTNVEAGGGGGLGRTITKNPSFTPPKPAKPHSANTDVSVTSSGVKTGASYAALMNQMGNAGATAPAPAIVSSRDSDSWSIASGPSTASTHHATTSASLICATSWTLCSSHWTHFGADSKKPVFGAPKRAMSKRAMTGLVILKNTLGGVEV